MVSRMRIPERVPRRVATRPPIERCKWIADRLAVGRNLTTNEAARRFEVSARTIFRDLEFMRDRLHAPLAFDSERSSYILTDKTYRLPLADLSAGELIALLFAERVSRQYHGTPYENDVRRAFAKIGDWLPGEIDLDQQRLDEMLALDLGPVPVPSPATFRTIVEALLSRRRLLVSYHSLTSGRRRERRLEPYKVFNLRGTWYVAAYDDLRHAVRDFAIHRVETAKTLDEPYVIDPRWSFAAYMRHSFGIEKGRTPIRVAIRFAPRQARWIRERTWHESARIQEGLDGSCVLHLSVAGLDEVKRWVLQFGSEAEILRPASLRRQVSRELELALRGYRSGRRGNGNSAAGVEGAPRRP
jgi:predicted DNA-binding transcriptional regulator YafY